MLNIRCCLTARQETPARFSGATLRMSSRCEIDWSPWVRWWTPPELVVAFLARYWLLALSLDAKRWRFQDLVKCHKRKWNEWSIARARSICLAAVILADNFYLPMIPGRITLMSLRSSSLCARIKSAPFHWTNNLIMLLNILIRCSPHKAVISPRRRRNATAGVVLRWNEMIVATIYWCTPPEPPTDIPYWLVSMPITVVDQ